MNFQCMVSMTLLICSINWSLHHIHINYLDPASVTCTIHSLVNGITHSYLLMENETLFKEGGLHIVPLWNYMYWTDCSSILPLSGRMPRDSRFQNLCKPCSRVSYSERASTLNKWLEQLLKTGLTLESLACPPWWAKVIPTQGRSQWPQGLLISLSSLWQGPSTSPIQSEVQFQGCPGHGWVCETNFLHVGITLPGKMWQMWRTLIAVNLSELPSLVSSSRSNISHISLLPSY